MEKLSALLGVVDLAVTGLVHVVPGHLQRQWRKRGRKGGRGGRHAADAERTSGQRSQGELWSPHVHAGGRAMLPHSPGRAGDRLCPP